MSIGHKKEQRYVIGRSRKKRPKTFKTKELAEAWAKKEGIAKFELVYVRKDKIKVQAI